MTTAWTLTRDQICRKALRKVGNLARGVTPNADDMALAVEALDGILKELPIFGYSWPQTTLVQASLTLTANVATVTLPTDYRHGAIVSYVDAAGKEVQLPLTTYEAYLAIPLKTEGAAYPTLGFVDRGNVLHVWPVQTSNLAAKVSYEQIIADTVPLQAIALDPTWMIGIVYGVAAEIGDEFGADEGQIARWAASWGARRALGIAYHSARTPGRITVDD